MKRWVRNLFIRLVLAFPVVYIVADYLEDLTETGGPERSEGLIPIITNLPNHIIQLASGAGYLGIFSLMLLEAAAFPVPSEIILPLAGYLVSRGVLQFWPVVFYSTIASLIGSFIDYSVGWKLGNPLVTGQVKVPYVGARHLSRVKAWFDFYGPTAVAVLRLVPGARVLISFPAGAYRMDKWKFAIYTMIGCLPWNITLVYLGWWLGSSWEAIVTTFTYINIAVYGTIIALVAWLAWQAVFKKREGRRP
jgi:membrane protein DedA with SNARE-associated domain